LIVLYRNRNWYSRIVVVWLHRGSIEFIDQLPAERKQSAKKIEKSECPACSRKQCEYTSHLQYWHPFKHENL